MQYETRWDVVDEHLEESEALVSLWEHSLTSPFFTLDEVRDRPESRLLAHVDALVVGGEAVADDRLIPCIEEETDARCVVSASLALLQSGSPHRLDWLLHRLPEANEDAQQAIVRALGLCRHPQISARLLADYRRAEDWQRRAPLAAALVRRQVPMDADLPDAIRSDAPKLVEAAARAAAFGARGRNLTLVEPLLDSEDASIQAAALRTGSILGSRIAWERGLRWARDADSALRADALTLVALVGDAGQQAWIGQLLARGGGPEVVWAAGFTGRVECARACVELLDDSRLGPLAAEALCAIAGAGSTSNDYPTPAVESEDDDGDEEEEGDTQLPTPDADALREWWSNNEHRFDPQERYLRGEPYTHGSLLRAIRHESMRRRDLLALELSIRTRGAAAVATSAFASTQLQQCEQLDSLPAVDCRRPYSRISP